MRITLTNDRPDELEIDRVSMTDQKQVEKFVARVRAAAHILWPREEPDIRGILRDRE